MSYFQHRLRMKLCAKKWKVECTTKPNWLELPVDLTKNILQRLDTVDIVTSARNVCPLWWNVCKDPLMWRTIHMIKRVSPFDFRCLEKICHCAVDLSCGYRNTERKKLYNVIDNYKF